ncbi:hypothetical protein [Rahnella sp. PCH160]|uniref:hypothetical protein n=1 Tax=Rahnella sp. PCH160 TaxID=3447928 RepID=UPI0039FC490E
MINIMPESHNRHDDEKAEESPGLDFLITRITGKRQADRPKRFSYAPSECY